MPGKPDLKKVVKIECAENSINLLNLKSDSEPIICARISDGDNLASVTLTKKSAKQLIKVLQKFIDKGYV